MISGGVIALQQPAVVGIQPPDPVYKAIRALYGTIVPLGILLRRPDEKCVYTDRIGPVFLYERIGADRIPLGLGHLGPVPANHALGEEPLERLVESYESFVPQELDDKPRIEQVEYRVLHASYVLVDREPGVDQVGIERTPVVAGREVPEKVPARVHEGVHRIGVALRLPPAAGADGTDEFGRCCEWALAVTPRHEIGRLGQDDGKLILRNRPRAAFPAVDHRYRRPPVPLPRYEPILEPVMDGAPGEPP